MVRSALLKGTLPLLILSVIGDGELYGYELAQELRARSGALFAPSEGSLYPALHRLEAEGVLVGTWRPGPSGPRRRYYRLTPKGSRLLSSSREEWAKLSAIVGRIAAPAT